LPDFAFCTLSVEVGEPAELPKCTDKLAPLLETDPEKPLLTEYNKSLKNHFCSDITLPKPQLFTKKCVFCGRYKNFLKIF